MKKPSLRVAAACCAAVCLSLPAFAAAPAPPAEFVDPDDPAVAEIRRQGEAALDRLSVKLQEELDAAITRRGPDGAVDTCHLKAPAVIKGIQKNLPAVQSLKLTALRLRSSGNAPDAADRLALDYMQQRFDRGNRLPDVLLQRVDRAGGPEWRVYRALSAHQGCLMCHGDTDAPSPGLRAKLQERYPTDEAMGYAAGDIRGLLRVIVAAVPPAPPAPAAPKN